MKKDSNCLFFCLLAYFLLPEKGAMTSQNSEKIFFKSGSIELGGATVNIENAMATDAYIKFKSVVKNNTTRYLLVKPGKLYC